MDLPDESLRGRRAKAVERCEGQISWYERHVGRARLLYRLLQSAAVVLAGLTPALSVWPDLVPYQAIPAALASVAIAISGLWAWQENWVRFATTAEALKEELVRFETRTGEDYAATLDEQRALGNFVARIEGLAAAEVASWSTRQSRGGAGQEP